mgnify:CR=1 FL=1
MPKRKSVRQREWGRFKFTGMGLTRFKSLFKQATGSSWAAFLTARRMREARTLLLGGRGVAEVAREVGYRSLTSFSAAFAKTFGCPPASSRIAPPWQL